MLLLPDAAAFLAGVIRQSECEWVFSRGVPIVRVSLEHTYEYSYVYLQSLLPLLLSFSLMVLTTKHKSWAFYSYIVLTYTGMYLAWAMVLLLLQIGVDWKRGKSAIEAVKWTLAVAKRNNTCIGGRINHFAGWTVVHACMHVRVEERCKACGWGVGDSVI